MGKPPSIAIWQLEYPHSLRKGVRIGVRSGIFYLMSKFLLPRDAALEL